MYFFKRTLRKIPRKLFVIPVGFSAPAFIGTKAWLPAMRASGRIKLKYYVPSRDTEEAEFVRKHLEVPKRYVWTNLRALLQKMKDRGERMPDAIAIAVETTGHLELIEIAAEFGIKFVICDKPLVANLEQLAKLQELVARTGIVIYVTYNHEYNVAVQYMRRIPNKERIIGWFLQSWLHNYDYMNPNRQAEARLKDPWCTPNDLLTHNEHGVETIGGAPLEIVTTAQVGTKGNGGHSGNPVRTCIDHASMTGVLANGIQIELKVSQAEEKPHGDNIGFLVRTKDGKSWMWRLFAPESLWFSELANADPDKLEQWTRLERGEWDQFGDASDAFDQKQPGCHTIGWDGMWVILFLSIYGDIIVRLSLIARKDLPPIMALPVPQFEDAGVQIARGIAAVVKCAQDGKPVRLDSLAA